MADIKPFKLLPQQKADLLNAIDSSILGTRTSATRSKDVDIKAAFEVKIKRLQDLFVMIRQDY